MYPIDQDLYDQTKADVQVPHLRGWIEDTIAFTENNILRDTFSINAQCTESTKISIGTVYTKTLKMTLCHGVANYRRQWKGKKIVIEQGVEIPRLNDTPVIKWIPMGTFYASEGVWTPKGINIKAYDDMMKFDKAIDFTQTREIRIYAQDRSTYRAYQVTVNKHQAATGKLLWEEMPVGSYPVDEVKEEWEQIVANAGLDRFIGAGTTEAYAFDKEGHLMVTTDQGATWEIDDLDDDLSLLPHESVAFVSYPFEANEQTDYQMIVGESGEIGNESSVWRKIVEYGDDSQPGKWVYMPYESYNKYYLPNLPDMSLVWFHKTVMAISSTYILITRDGGITWKESATMQLPAGDLMDVEARTDDKGALWLKEKNSDKVWRGILVEE